MALVVDEDSIVSDARWIKQAFFQRKLGGAGANSTALSDSFNFYDTTLGGNRSINPPPQYTRWSDPKLSTIASGCKSMGEYYKRSQDDNDQRISLQFGVPEFNALSSFMSNFYDRKMGILARTGDASTGVMFNVGNTLGTLFTLPLQTFFGLNYVYNRISSALSGNPYSKFYYLKPTMPLYWNAVSLMFNKIAADMGILDVVDPDEIEDGARKSTVANMLQLKSMLPDVISEGSGDLYSIDVKSIASRSQRLANSFNDKLYEINEEIGKSGLTGEAAEVAFRDRVNEVRRQQFTARNQSWGTPKAYAEAYAGSPIGDGQDPSAYVPEVDVTNPNYAQAEENAIPQAQKEDRSVFSRFEGLADFMKAELQEGSAFVTFTVNNTGPVDHGFSNSTKSAPLKEAANSAAQTARDLTINLAGGNLTDNFVGNAVESVLTGVGDLLGGALSSVGLDGFNAVAGGSMMDMPDVFEDSSADLSETSYTIRLGTPYGNKYSILTRIYLPLCCLLAGVLPRRTGKNSYDAPFICRLHSQAREEIKLGIIKSLNISLASSNIGRSVDELPTAVDVTFTVERMDKMMHMALSDSILDSITSFSAFDEDTVFSDFLTTLAGTDLQSQYYMGNRLSRAWKKTVVDWNSFGTKSYFAQWFSGILPGKVLSGYMKYGDI